MKVSIITTCFNSAETIRDALESVASQTYKNIEHIIIDAKSVDDTLSIVGAFPHVAKILSEVDNGVYYGMNKGLELCTGDIICFLNADDWYARNDVISKVVQIMTDENAKVVYGNLQYVDRVNINKVSRTWISGKFKRKNLYYGWMPPHPAFFAHREVYNKVGLFNTALRNAADYEMMLRIFIKHEFDASYLALILVKMRRGGISNANLKYRMRANREDHLAWQMNGLNPGPFTRYLKPLRKLLQFIVR